MEQRWIEGTCSVVPASHPNPRAFFPRSLGRQLSFPCAAGIAPSDSGVGLRAPKFQFRKEGLTLGGGRKTRPKTPRAG